jgi:hypothetical protein
MYCFHYGSMRTTVTLDPDVERMLRLKVRVSRKSFNASNGVVQPFHPFLHQPVSSLPGNARFHARPQSASLLEPPPAGGMFFLADRVKQARYRLLERQRNIKMG